MNKEPLRETVGGFTGRQRGLASFCQRQQFSILLIFISRGSMAPPLTKFACLDCCRVFKRPADTTQKTCPRCAGVTHRTGSDFRAPSATDKTGWAVATFLICSGLPYYRIGEKYPTTLREARQFAEKYASDAVDMTANRPVPLHWPRDHIA